MQVQCRFDLRCGVFVWVVGGGAGVLCTVWSLLVSTIFYRVKSGYIVQMWCTSQRRVER